MLSGDTFVDLSEYNVSETGLGGCEICTGVVTSTDSYEGSALLNAWAKDASDIFLRLVC